MDTNKNSNSTDLRTITFNASRRRFLTHTGTLASSTLLPTPAFTFPFTVNDTPPALVTSGIGFNGERKDPVTGGYHLGNGYRMYNPHLHQFQSYDGLSPFGQGGINGYAYCLGDPINQDDPSGHFAILSLLIGAIVGAIIGSGISAISEGIQCAINPEHKFDWKQVGIGAALGFISGGFSTAAKGATTSVKVGLAIVDATVSGGADFGLNVAAGTPVKQSGLNAGIGVLIGLSTFGVGLGVKTLGSSLSEVNQRLATIKTVGLSGRGAPKIAKKWRFEGGGISRDHRIDMHVNNGLLNGDPLYIHYTNREGYDAILNSKYFRAAPNTARRGTRAKSSVYLCQAKDAMNNEEAHLNLFLGEERYRNSATHSFIFSFREPQLLDPRPVTIGSHINEILYPNNIPFRKINLLYSGVNPFI
ncbi:hypothetical protein SKA34_00882 [Photobacterium sp. SKA34]|uniref:RHS repeat-associated core domain-containing protein n=1 Tax=Photobacterium sp. SKA34 TaxID=121723 RepID=UPI00006B699C|nr:RHS repeat-associated core domain-containing protein [Photobacterium sp. SKA34]EAR53345.1 hypothetical protein SKA34_00882 [Photobacterium sp. SKA34]